MCRHQICGSPKSVLDGRLGHLLFVREGTLMAQPFDARKLQLAGEPFPVAERVEARIGHGAYSVSDNGVLAWREGASGLRTQLTWFDREGKKLATAGKPGYYNNVALSPDSRQAAAEHSPGSDSNRDLWLFDLARDSPSRFTFHAALDGMRVWSPDGGRIVFASGRDGPLNLYEKTSSGAGNETALLQSNTAKTPFDWSRDGRFLVYSNLDPKTRLDLWVLPMTADRKPAPYLQTEFDESQGQFSRRQVDGLRVDRIGRGPSVRAAIPGRRRQATDLLLGRLPAALARRRQGIVLPGAGRGADVGGNPRGAQV